MNLFRASTFCLAVAAAAAAGCDSGKKQPPQAPAAAGHGLPHGMAPGSAPAGASPTPIALTAPEVYVSLAMGAKSRAGVVHAFSQARSAALAPGLIEVSRFAEAGLAEPLSAEESAALRLVTKQHFATADWGEWMRWWWNDGAREDPAGYAPMRQYLYSSVSRDYERMLDPGAPRRARPSEIILRPGVKLGDVPALDRPKALAPGAPELAAFDDAMPILGVRTRGEARAYPLSVLGFHEIVNDQLGGEAIVVAHNPLGRSFAVWRVPELEGARPKFEFSSLVHRADVLLYERQTASLWSAREGRALWGRSAGAEPTVSFEAIPATVTTWGAWRALCPESSLVSFETGYPRNYAAGHPYEPDYASDAVGFPVARLDRRLPSKEKVFTVALGGDAVAYPYSELPPRGVILDEIGGEMVLISVIAAREEIRAYRAGPYLMRALDSPYELEHIQTRTRWKLTEEGIVLGTPATGMVKLDRLAEAGPALWFAWANWHPETRVFRDRDYRARMAETRWH